MRTSSVIHVEQKGDFAETESSLKMFYLSGEPETTRNFAFPVFNCPFVLKDSQKGLGVFLEKPAVSGQLLVLSKAVSSCECTLDYQPYQHSKGALIQAQKLQWIATNSRIPPKISQHLGHHFAKAISTASTSELAMINLLDSHQYSTAPDAQDDQTRRRVTKRRLVKGLLELSLPESEGHKLELLDAEKMRNILSNNAMCDKVRSLSLVETGIVENCEAWGLWVIPSWINHSCSPNCHRIRIGDSMVIRAATNIEAGFELTLPYFDLFQSVTMREIDCAVFGFRCECYRCLFERSLGKQYYDIEEEISRLSLQMQNMWTLHLEPGGPELTDSLLIKLMEKIIPISILIDNLRDSTWWDTANQTERTISANEEGQLPVSHSGRASQAELGDSEFDLDDSESDDDYIVTFSHYWVKASFIDAYIAHYSLCEVGYFRLNDPLVPCGKLVDLHRGAVSESDEVKRLLRVVEAASEIVDLVEIVHPGNMLGQEFYSILFKACSEFVQCDLKDNNFLGIVRIFYSFVQSDALRFFSNYYGVVDDETLGLLIGTNP